MGTPIIPTTDPQSPLPSTEPAAPAPAESIAEHAASFHPDAVPADETPAEKIEREHHSAQQRRDRQNGQFRDGKRRHRAASAIAGPEDVPRIRELTGKVRTAEERATALEAELNALMARPAPTGSPVAGSAAAVAKPSMPSGGSPPPAAQPAPAADPEPDPADATTYPDGQYDRKYLKDQARWEARQELATYQQSLKDQATKAERETAERASREQWSTRVATAKAAYADFEAVAFSPTTIPEGSIVDRWIMEHATGADVLYHLQKHPDERDALLRMPVLEQIERLALLSQRFASPQRAQAGTTGSVATPQPRSQPARPPNPVRTEAHSAGTAPPTDGSLSIAEHGRAFGPKRR